MRPILDTASEPKLHVESRGSGPVLVLAHGFGGSARNFRPQTKALSDELRTVAYDARGHSRSEAPDAAGAYTIERLVDDFARVSRDATEEPVLAAGLSLGSATALAFALRAPERLRGLVLASPPAGSSDRSRRDWALEFARAIEVRGLEAAGETFVWGARSRFDPRGANLIRQGFLEHPPHGLKRILLETLAVLEGPDVLEPELRALQTPTLVIAGSEDAGSVPVARRLVELLPRGRLVVIEGAGHVVNLAAPEAFNAAVREFAREILDR